MFALKRSLAVLVLGFTAQNLVFATTEAAPSVAPAVPMEAPVAPAPQVSAAPALDPAVARTMLTLLATVLASATATGAGDPGDAIERALERLWRNPNSQAQVTRMIESALTQSLNQPGVALDPETRALVRSVVQSAVALVKREVAAGTTSPAWR